MEDQQKQTHWKRAVMALLGPSALVLLVFFVFDQRTQNAVDLMAENCEQTGRHLQIEKISWGGVRGRCIQGAEP